MISHGLNYETTHVSHRSQSYYAEEVLPSTFKLLPSNLWLLSFSSSLEILLEQRKLPIICTLDSRKEFGSLDPMDLSEKLLGPWRRGSTQVRTGSHHLHTDKNTPHHLPQ